VTEPEVALVFSPEAWVEGLHRHLTDHGGARVRQVVMEPSVALDEEYGTLIVSHRWPALTRPFIEAVHAGGRRLLGVFDPTEPAGREHLLELGADRVIESDAPMSAFLDALVELAPVERPGGSAEGDLRRMIGPLPTPFSGARPAPVVAVGGPAGGGATELAIEMARSASEGRPAVALADADDVAPAVAQRLALPIEPNLRTAIDALEYGMGELDAAFTSAPDGLFRVLGGLPNVASWSQVRPSEVLDVLEAVAAEHTTMVDLSNRIEDVSAGIGRGRYGITRAVVGTADALVVVGQATPVGVTRVLGWVAEARTLTEVPVHVVVNRCPNDAYRRAEIADEIHRTFPPTTLWFVPHDPRVDRAAWAGTLVAAGPFTRAVVALTAEVLPAPTNGARHPRPARGRRLAPWAHAR
jgi:MinD-like ATPase involved in chromosome partitioning or flagellar assembly